jgi:hypothetical protein
LLAPLERDLYGLLLVALHAVVDWRKQQVLKPIKTGRGAHKSHNLDET